MLVSYAMGTKGRKPMRRQAAAAAQHYQDSPTAAEAAVMASVR